MITALGLQRMEKELRPGIGALLEKARFKNRSLSVEDVVFVIAPRINAAGRLEHGKTAVELLIADEEKAAAFNAESLDGNNKNRRELDKLITAEALALLEADAGFAARRSTVVFQPHWHKGVVGIVASRLIETYYRPTVVLTESNGKVTGSARTVKGFDLYAALEECADLFENFGGHMHAAGLTLAPENLETFRTRFEESVARRITPEQLWPEVAADTPLPITEIDAGFYRVLKQFAPFGPGNMNPVFVSEPLRLYNQGLRVVGDDHLQLQVWNPAAGSGAFKAIAFKQAKRFEDVRSAETFRLCYSVNENVFSPDDERVIRTLDLDVKEILIEK